LPDAKDLVDKALANLAYTGEVDLDFAETLEPRCEPLCLSAGDEVPAVLEACNGPT
jgi:hypothetical protein